MIAVLVDPYGGHAVTLTETEHRNLKAHLDIMRSTDFEEHQTVLNTVVRDFEFAVADKTPEQKHLLSDMTKKHLLAKIAYDYNAYNLVEDHMIGFLVQMQGEPVEALNESEVTLLWDALKTMRGGGWFPVWLSVQLHFTGNSTRPDDKLPSPLKIMGTLLDDAEEYQHQTETLKHMIETRPDLFVSKSAAELKPPEGNKPPESKVERPEPKSRSHRKVSKKAA